MTEHNNNATERYETEMGIAIKDMKMALGCYDNDWTESGHSHLLTGLMQLDRAVDMIDGGQTDE